MLRSRAGFLALGASLIHSVRGDLSVYTDAALASGWENWSWSSTINFAATDVYEGLSSLSSVTTAYGAVSFYLEGAGFGSGYAGLKFDISGAQPDISLSLASTADNANSPSMPLSALTKTAVKQGAWTTVLVDFSALPGSGTPLATDTWNRITFQAGGNGATVSTNEIF